MDTTPEPRPGYNLDDDADLRISSEGGHADDDLDDTYGFNADETDDDGRVNRNR